MIQRMLSGSIWNMRARTSSVKVKVNAKRRSGDTYTSIGNGVANLLLQVQTWSEVLKIDVETLLDLISIEGDDCVVYLPACFLTPEHVLRYRSILAAFGIVPKSKPLAPYAGESELSTSVCSFLLYRDDELGRPQMMLSLERALTKVFYFFHRSRQLQFFRGSLLQLLDLEQFCRRELPLFGRFHFTSRLCTVLQ